MIDTPRYNKVIHINNTRLQQESKEKVPFWNIKKPKEIFYIFSLYTIRYTHA